MINFFIDRPIFAWVIAIVTMLAGAFSITQLPVSQYPDIAPTTIRVSASYSGATASAVQNSVTTVLEDAMTDVDGMLYMVSSSREGSASLTLTFDESVSGVDAQNAVQTKISNVEGQLPDTVQTAGVTVTRSSSSILLVGAIVSTDGTYSTLQLGDILDETISGPVQRTTGVGGINSFGSGYAMRIWLDPLKLAQYQLTPTDVTTAVSNQNSTVSVGSLGDQPTTQGQQFTASITAQSQLTTVEEFESILLKSEEGGSTVYLGDVARVEIGQESYGSDSRFDGKNAAGFGVNLATGANAVETAAAVRATLANLSGALPEGVQIEYAYDTAPFVELSIQKVEHTLIEAIVLVFLVILIFLQKFRATLIPIIAVPVVLLGAFAILAAFGYSINTLTMFAMVLAIGLLVDDAIVVVENVERVMEEEGLSPRDATRKSMGQIQGALIGIALVLSAVFLPMAFFGGSTGVIYRQFSVTIISAMVLSVIVALILTPALCASLLRQKHGPAIAPARWFNRNFDRMVEGYGALVTKFLWKPFLALVVLAGIGVAAWGIYGRLPSSFLPAEDQGVLMTMVNLTEGSTAAQTLAVVEDIEDYLLNEESEGVEATFAALGFGFGGSGQNAAMLFIKLKDFEERTGTDQTAAAIALRANMKFGNLRAGQVFFMQPPSIPGLGNSSGFEMYLVDQAGNGTQALIEAADTLVAQATADSRLTNMRASGTEAQSALQIDIDQQKAESLGVTVSSVNSMLSTIFSGRSVNDFILGTSLRPVIVQADAPYRMQPEDIDKWYALNSGGEMVPFSAFMTTQWVSVEPSLARYGGTDALSISGSNSDTASSGAAMDAMEELTANLSGGYGVAWTGLSYQERQSGDQAPYLYALSVLVVFLFLAALYESWSVPFSVMLAVPVGVLGALAAAWAFGQSNDVYFKVGILTTIGLAAKNAILIVEFAKDLEAEGKELIAATVEAAKLRLRPILMTSLAFMLGVLPLATASGAGAAAQNAIGIGVLGGMFTATFIGVFMVPSFYVLVRHLSDKKARKAHKARA
ncbi:Multidrug efflux pump subunit AcrB [Aquimixticola soesokkakensis]|uniref:Efflux pump membrane transporter n=1 Tax=Aquimixticola soesokkakensis TaxID=1519096 RepID=A0A1Y5S5J7_9RHOB|nr:efflux RND transporter permease subunit [Aquimixticola soesokkakensis]SLN32988.1 Multidrug efflux pump subunit AcrB [Aquimixticola soesokkakensis]